MSLLAQGQGDKEDNYPLKITQLYKNCLCKAPITIKAVANYVHKSFQNDLGSDDVNAC